MSRLSVHTLRLQDSTVCSMVVRSDCLCLPLSRSLCHSQLLLSHFALITFAFFHSLTVTAVPLIWNSSLVCLRLFRSAVQNFNCIVGRSRTQKFIANIIGLLPSV